ncbi:MAG TPA: hypothetical protein VNV16_08825, partial [Methylibium sp.]|nr:hypothetical protein [Methylibium sp.]
MSAPPPAPPPRRRALRWIVLALLPPLLLAAALAAAWQSLHTAAGTLWWWEKVLPRLAGVQAGVPSGALLGSEARFRLEHLVIERGALRLRIEALALDGLSLGALQATAPHARLQARRLAAGPAAAHGVRWPAARR